MGSYVALDVSLRSTSVHVVDEAGKMSLARKVRQ
jgi:hypothetical protein